MWGTRFRIDKASLKGMFQLGMDQGFMSSDFWSRVASQWGLLPLFEMDSVLWLKKGKGIDLPDSTKLNSLGGLRPSFLFISSGNNSSERVIVFTISATISLFHLKTVVFLNISGRTVGSNLYP